MAPNTGTVTPLNTGGTSAIEADWRLQDMARRHDELMRKSLEGLHLDPDTYAKMIGAVNQGAQSSTQGANSTQSYTSADLESMIRMRLRSEKSSFFDHWHAHKIKDEKVVVLVVNDGETVLLEDAWPLFPSDTLITQLRLLEK